MDLSLTTAQIERLKDAQNAISQVLSEAQDSSTRDERGGCNECYGTCKDECTGCHTCSDTSKVG